MWIMSRQGGHSRDTALGVRDPPCNPPRNAPPLRAAALLCDRVARSSCDLQEFRAGLLQHLAVLGVHEVQAILVDHLHLHALPFLPAGRADPAEHLLLEDARVTHAPRFWWLAGLSATHAGDGQGSAPKPAIIARRDDLLSLGGRGQERQRAEVTVARTRRAMRSASRASRTVNSMPQPGGRAILI